MSDQQRVKSKIILTPFQFILKPVQPWSEVLGRVRLFVTPWTVAHQAPLSMEFSRQEHWNGLPFPSPGDRPNSGIEPRSPALQADTLPSEPPGKTNLVTQILILTNINFT